MLHTSMNFANTILFLQLCLTSLRFGVRCTPIRLNTPCMLSRTPLHLLARVDGVKKIFTRMNAMIPQPLPRDDFPTVLARMMQGAGVTTQTELAALLEIGKAAISDAKRRNIVPAEWYLKLCRAPYYLNPLWLESGVGDMRLGHAYHASESPLSDEASREASQKQTRSTPSKPSGVAETAPPYGEEAPTHINKAAQEEIIVPMAMPRVTPEGGLAPSEDSPPCTFSKAWLKAKGSPEAMKLLRITGEAMIPTLKERDFVLVDESQTDILEGAIYVLRMDTQMVVKRVDMRPGSLLLLSDNREFYPPIEVTLPCADVAVIGRVVWVCRDL